MKPAESRNAHRFVYSNGLQNLGDELVAAKTVLPWLFQSAGVPAGLTGLLVPIRESGSMLPQAAMTQWVIQSPSRKRLWMLGSSIQALAALAIAVTALLADGLLLGLIILVLLGVLSLGRALCSITGKDVQGRTISKGKRGTVTGRATTVGGISTLIVAGLLVLLGDLDRTGIIALLLVGAVAWAVAALVFAGISEPPTEPAGQQAPAKPEQSEANHWWTDTWTLFRQDKQFRDFVIVRALMLVTALSTAFIVTLAHTVGNDSLGSLAGFMLASGLASLCGGTVSGKLSDISSCKVMTYSAGLASTLLILIVLAAATLPAAINFYLLPLGFFAVQLVHTGIRVARKTYVADMAEGDKRTHYVAAGNTLMGIILLLVGGISTIIASAGNAWALIFLAGVGFLGVWRAGRLEEVSK
ncbi:MFS transporter [Corynebacterium sp. L4756]|uniref:MFS transporter n=1 Tax=unclassified Corynebacterium TaxID=2624378 RepID=UPI00374D449A